MSKKFICELCKKTFNHKIEFTKHKNMKETCVIMQKNIQSKEVKNDIKNELKNLFKTCLNILRDNEHLTGDKALRTLSYLLILRLLEPQLGNKIDIDNYNYDFSSYNEDVVENHKKKLLEIVRFSNLAKEKEDNIPVLIKYLWDDVLSVHPITKNIFLKDKGFNIQRQSTYKKLIDKLYTFDFEGIEKDILGKVYEDVIKDVMIGKVLGQFFTPPEVKKIMIKLINPQLKEDGTIEKIFDPAMGTGGFLISSLRYLLQQSKEKGIKMDWNFICNGGLGGREAEPDTYQLALSNMIIASGHMFEHLERGDSIRNPITNKYDIIFANPPFGIKGLKYDDFNSSLKSQYLPIKSDNAVSLFIQAIIYMLKIDGRCVVVLPNGQDLFSKTNKTLIAVREYLMKTCDLKEIIHIPSGIFTNTSIKTCIFYFVKKREGIDVVETKIKTSKSQKETGRNYKFAKEYQTTIVKFYDYDFEKEIKTLLVEVPIEIIVSNSYSLNYAEYMKDETKEEKNEEFVVKTLGEVCKTIKGNKKRSKDGKKNGLYPLYYCSILGNLYLDTFDYTGEGIIINKTNGSGKSMVYYGCNNYNVGETTIHFKSKIDELKTKYIYYYLFYNIELLEKYYIGANQKSIIEEDLFKIEIPIPSLKHQQEIVNYLDFIYEKTNKTSNDKIAELKQLNKLCINNQQLFGNNIIKTLGEVCKVNQGTYIKYDMKIQGEYPVYGGGNISYYINQYNREDEIIVAKDGISADCVRYEKNKFFLNHHGWTIICKDEISKKYMFYHLQSVQPELLSIAKGTAQLGINQEKFYELKIPIPSLERQQEIVKYCEHNDALIKQLENEIENNKKIAKQFIENFTKSQENM